MNRPTPAPASREVRIPCGESGLSGDLVLPARAYRLVVFAHGGGRHSAPPASKTPTPTWKYRTLAPGQG